jgi:uncharacterized membrane protein (UPF0127 family)
MRLLRIVRQQDGAVVAQRARIADGFLSRLRGLIGTTRFPEGEGLLFPRCNSIHMWMMSIPIDAVFLGKCEGGWRVLSAHPGLRPWKLLPVGNGKAEDVLELPVGTVDRLSIRAGEVLCIAS